MLKKTFLLSLCTCSILANIDINDLEKEKYFQQKANQIINQEYTIKNIVEELMLKTGGYGLFTNSDNIPYLSSCTPSINVIGNANFGSFCSLKVHPNYYKSITTQDGLNWINGELNPSQNYTFNNTLLTNYLYNKKFNDTNYYLKKEKDFFNINYLGEIDVIKIDFNPKENSLTLYNTLCKNNCNLIPSQIKDKWETDFKRGLEEVSITPTGSVVKFDLSYLISSSMKFMYECLSKHPNSIPIFNINITKNTKKIEGINQDVYDLSSDLNYTNISFTNNNFDICVSTLKGSAYNLLAMPKSSGEHFDLIFKTYGNEVLNINRDFSNQGLLPYTTTDNNVYAVDINGNIIQDSNGNNIFAGEHIDKNPQVNYESKSGIYTNINKYQQLHLSSIPLLESTTGQLLGVQERKALFNPLNINNEKNINFFGKLPVEVIQVPYLHTLFSDSSNLISATDYENFKDKLTKSNFIIIPDRIISRGRCELTKVSGTNYAKPCNINSDCTTANDICKGAGQLGVIRKYLLEEENGNKIVSPIYTSNLSIPCVNSPEKGILGTNIGPMNSVLCELPKTYNDSNTICTYNSIHKDILKDINNGEEFTFIVERFNNLNYQNDFNLREELEDFINSDTNLNNGFDITEQQYGYSNLTNNSTLLQNIDKDLTISKNFINSYKSNLDDLDPYVLSEDLYWNKTEKGEISFRREKYMNHFPIVGDPEKYIKHVFLVNDINNDNKLGNTLALFYNRTNKSFEYLDYDNHQRTFTGSGETEVLGELFFSKTVGDFFFKQVNKNVYRCSDNLAKCNVDSDCEGTNTCDLTTDNTITLNFIKNYYGKPVINDTEITDCRDNNGILSSIAISNAILPEKMELGLILNQFHGILDNKDPK